jgi:trans-aconitate methyltransferase
MGVAAHLGIDLREYDVRIRTFIPGYEEMLDVAAGAMDLAVTAPCVLDLGIGSGALSQRVLRVRPRARIVGIDSDPGMLALAARRLGGRLTPVEGDFSRALADGRRFDAITASFALHHVRTKRQKASLYARCFAALEPQGVLVNADCCLSASPQLQRDDRAFWRVHLERSYERAGAERFLRAWAREDVYFTLDDELGMLKAAGFEVDVVWRRRSFAVIVGTKTARSLTGHTGRNSARTRSRS